VNGTTPRTTIAQDAVRALAQHERVDPITLHQRIDFAANKTNRRTVGELNPQSRSPKNWRIYVFTLRKDATASLRKEGVTCPHAEPNWRPSAWT
jgi:chromosome partitioning protein